MSNIRVEPDTNIQQNTMNEVSGPANPDTTQPADTIPGIYVEQTDTHVAGVSKLTPNVKPHNLIMPKSVRAMSSLELK